MFNFFHKKISKSQPETQENDIVASISYIIKKNHASPLIDIELMNYNPETIKGFISLLDILGDDRFYIDTINIVKTLLIQENRHDLLIEIFSKIHDKFKARSSSVQNTKPCIKPSEMFKI